MSYFTADEKLRLSFEPFKPGDPPLGYVLALVQQPAASEEPVAWMRRPAEIESSGIRYQFRPLYAAPQPAPAPAASGEPADSEAEELQALNDKLAGILSRTAVALRGPEPPLTRWSWHDLPERAAAAIAAIDLMQRVAKNLAEQPDTAQPAPAPADIAAKLRDPVAVHAAMLRGEIAAPAIRDMLHVYGADALARWDNAQPAPAPAASGEPVAVIERDGVLWLNTNPHRLPVGTKLYATAAQPAPARVPSDIHSPHNACMYRDHCRALAAPPVVPGLTADQHFALREAHAIGASDAYFKAWPTHDNDAGRMLFERGFVRGFDSHARIIKRAAAPGAPDAQPKGAA
jgi:hypothetical protein